MEETGRLPGAGRFASLPESENTSGCSGAGGEVVHLVVEHDAVRDDACAEFQIDGRGQRHRVAGLVHHGHVRRPAIARRLCRSLCRGSVGVVGQHPVGLIALGEFAVVARIEKVSERHARERGSPRKRARSANPCLSASASS